MTADLMEAGTKAAVDIIKLDSVTASVVTNKDLVNKFLLTLHRYHTDGDVEIMFWLDGKKSDGTHVNATAFQYVKVVDHQSGELITYVPPILLDPNGILPSDVVAQLADIFYRSESLDKVMPGRGKVYLDKMLGDCITDKHNEADVWRRLWDDFFVRFGLSPVYNTEHTLAEETSDGDDGEMEDVEYL